MTVNVDQPNFDSNCIDFGTFVFKIRGEKFMPYLLQSDAQLQFTYYLPTNFCPPLSVKKLLHTRIQCYGWEVSYTVCAVHIIS